MSNLSDLPLFLTKASQLLQAQVQAISNAGEVEVAFTGMNAILSCRVLQSSESVLLLAAGDQVLVWLGDADLGGGVVLGRIGLQRDVPEPVVPAAEFAARPQSVVIESRGDLVLRNGHARIKLGADGEVEIVCTSFVTRSQRLLRLLAPFIKLN